VAAGVSAAGASAGALDVGGAAATSALPSRVLRAFRAATARFANDHALAGLRLDLASAQTIELAALPALAAVQLGDVPTLDGNLAIEHTALPDYRAFESIGKVGGDLTLHGNAAPVPAERAFADRIEIGGARSID